MRFFQTKAWLVISLAIFLNACTASESNTNTNAKKPANTNANAETTKDDLEEFGKIVNLPAQPEEVTWRESADKKILAVLKFSASDANTVVSQIEKQKPAQNAEINPENWFPPELIAQSQQSGNETLKGKEYSAADFFLAPYAKGKITRIDETNYFILDLSSE